MQYPYDEKNDLLDGENHQIKPTKLLKFNTASHEMYLLQYEDLNYSTTCRTILLKSHGQFFKLPLIDYKELTKLIEENNPVEVSIKSSFKDIQKIILGPTISIDLLKENLFVNSNYESTRECFLRLNDYVAYDIDNPFDVFDKTFYPSYKTYDENNSHVYVFAKSLDDEKYIEALKKEIKSNYQTVCDLNSFSTQVMIYRPNGSYVNQVLPNGKALKRYFIPGYHIHNIFFAPCLNKDKMIDTLESKRIEAIWEEPKDYQFCDALEYVSIDPEAGKKEARKKVFRQCYMGLLDMKIGDIYYCKNKGRTNLFEIK
jgi:hypothetical protein